MASTSVIERPAWQTDELVEEWVEQSIEIDEEDGEFQPIIEVSNGRFDDPYPGYASPDNSLSPRQTSTREGDGESNNGPGTFVIRSDRPAMQMDKVKHHVVGVKDFFSPLALEKMFEPPLSPSTPSPPPPPPVSRISKSTSAVFAPSKLAQQVLPDPTLSEIAEDDVLSLQEGQTTNHYTQDFEDSILETDLPNIGAIDGHVMPEDFHFTFSPPSVAATSTPNPPDTPKPLQHALTDPRLKLFQLNYDTYTREHLSAIVDSIPITPSRSGSAEADVRNPKRIRLSPSEESRTDSPQDTPVAPPERRNYVVESRSFMSAIRKNTRSVSLELSESERSQVTSTTRKVSSSSTEGTAVDNHQLSAHTVLTDSSNVRKAGTHAVLSTNRVKQDAAALMSAIKTSMDLDKGHYRGLSASTVASADGKENISIISRDPTGKSQLVATELLLEESIGYHNIAQKHSVSDAKGISSLHNLPLVAVLIAPPEPSAFSRSTLIPSQVASSPGPLVQAPAARSVSQASSLNRYVSSSTTTQASMQTTSSFVKHAGIPMAQITNITPADVPNLAGKVSGMIYDPQKMLWVKERLVHDIHPIQELEDSEDVFRDIDSLSAGEHSRRSQSLAIRADESSLTMDGAGVVNVMTGIASIDLVEDDVPTSEDDGPIGSDLKQFMEGEYETESEDDDYEPVSEENEVSDEAEADEPGSDQTVTQTIDIVNSSVAFPTAEQAEPSLSHPVVSFSTPIPRHRRPNVIPRSVLKSGSATPVAHQSSGRHRRSVSFSDGRNAGRIKGLHPDDSGSHTTSDRPSDGAHGSSNKTTESGLISVRTKFIQAQLDELASTSLDETPSKHMKSRARGHESLQSIPRASSEGSLESLHLLSNAGRAQRSFHRSSSLRGDSSMAKANATFLTECSFGVAHDNLVEVITDAQPYVPYWEDLSAIDLSGKLIESTARLKEFLPTLTKLDINNNKLSWLSGMPESLQVLTASSNLLTGLTSFNHISRLEVLDVSFNCIESVHQMSCLKRLRELRADGNSLSSVDGLEGLENLVIVSLKGCQLSNLNFAAVNWPKLETLDLSKNQISEVHDISSLQSLRALTLDDNKISEIVAVKPMPQLRILKLSANRLTVLDMAFFPHLRTLYADNNKLRKLRHTLSLKRLEVLSLRNQRCPQLELTLRDCRDVKRLYLSGNALSADFFQGSCHKLLYLELAGCQLRALPDTISTIAPNIRVLNLNYNFLKDIASLQGLVRLSKLTVIGCRLNSTKPLVRAVHKLSELELLDVRMNPCSLEMYLPLIIRDAPSALQPSEDQTAVMNEAVSSSRPGASWTELDAHFKRGLPDRSYVKRLTYRGVVMRACSNLKILDGITITENESRKAEMLLEKLEKA